MIINVYLFKKKLKYCKLIILILLFLLFKIILEKNDINLGYILMYSMVLKSNGDFK